MEALDFKENLAKLSIIDCRTKREWDDFNLGGMHIPLDHLLERINELSKDKKYVVICYNGTQSEISCRLLQAKGFTCENLVNGLEGYLSL